MKSRQQRDPFESGFGRLDLLITILTTILVVGLAALCIERWQYGARMAYCAANLKLLGTGMMLYSESNVGQLPYTMLKYDSRHYMTWDSLIYPYVPGGTKTNAAGERELLANRIFRCPSDTIGVPRDGSATSKPRRTYSMPWHHMNKANWPPGPDNSTGLGLWWSDKPSKGSEMALTSALSPNERIPSIRLNMIPDPSGTLLLTEKARTNNILFHFMGAEIRGVDEHLDTRVISMEDYHQGQFNYLMVDGHVVGLLPEQTIGIRGGVGIKNIWTIRPDD